jgi:uncharacterized protein YjbJ (UPF0337 family)
LAKTAEAMKRAAQRRTRNTTFRWLFIFHLLVKIRRRLCCPNGREPVAGGGATSTASEEEGVAGREKRAFPGGRCIIAGLFTLPWGGPDLAVSRPQQVNAAGPQRRFIMGIGEHGDKNVAKGAVNQVKGKVNEVAGAAVGDPGQELKGKAQKNLGKAQEKVGRSEEKAAE